LAGSKDVKEAKLAHSRLLSTVGDALGAEAAGSDAIADCTVWVLDALSRTSGVPPGVKAELVGRLGPVSDATLAALRGFTGTCCLCCLCWLGLAAMFVENDDLW
jgi:hypothetical protein